MITTQAVKLLDLSQEPHFPNIVAVSLGSGGDIIVLSSRDSIIFRDGRGRFESHSDSENDYRVYRTFDPLNERASQFTSFKARENFSHVQPLRRGGWLLVCPRLVGLNGENAFCYDATGQREHTFYAGDYISDVQTTSNNEVWVSYMDQGVLSQIEPSCNGLAEMDLNGHVTFQMRYCTGVDNVVDVYALNVVNDRDIWLCYYTDFPLVHLRDRRLYKRWDDLGVYGSRAFAVTEESAVFAGSYQQRSSLFLTNLWSNYEPVEVIPLDDNGVPIEFDYAVGRGATLLLVRNKEAFSINAHELSHLMKRGKRK